MVPKGEKFLETIRYYHRQNWIAGADAVLLIDNSQKQCKK